MRHLIALDLSTTCTGWAAFDLDTKALISYGILKPNMKGLSKLTYPKQQLQKMIDLSFKIKGLFENYPPYHIVIEEIAGSKNRLGQKVLDGLHWIVLFHIQEYIDIVSYYDVSGADGWRTNLNLRLSEGDKINNKESKKINKDLERGSRHLPIIDAKDLACRHVNLKYGLSLDPQANQFDADVGDAVSLGDAWLQYKKPNHL